MKNNKFAIFYSWQSYIGGYANRVYIKDKIISAFKELNIDIELLEDSRGTTGAPDIPNTILTKIVQSDIFVCDITSAVACCVNLLQYIIKMFQHCHIKVRIILFYSDSSRNARSTATDYYRLHIILPVCE